MASSETTVVSKSIAVSKFIKPKTGANKKVAKKIVCNKMERGEPVNCVILSAIMFDLVYFTILLGYFLKNVYNLDMTLQLEKERKDLREFKIIKSKDEFFRIQDKLQNINRSDRSIYEIVRNVYKLSFKILDENDISAIDLKRDFARLRDECIRYDFLSDLFAYAVYIINQEFLQMEKYRSSNFNPRKKDKMTEEELVKNYERIVNNLNKIFLS